MQVPPLMQQRGQAPPDMHVGGELSAMAACFSRSSLKRMRASNHPLDLTGLPPDLHEALQTAQRQADSYIVRSAKLAAVGGMDYVPPAGMLVQLPPMRKVGVRRFKCACAWQCTVPQSVCQRVHLLHACRWMSEYCSSSCSR